MYLDDAIVRGGQNLREHTMQFCTISHNIKKHRLKYEANKALVICNKLQFLGFLATTQGIHPPNTLDMFNLLLSR